jgi:hypothetical protein
VTKASCGKYYPGCNVGMSRLNLLALERLTFADM